MNETLLCDELKLFARFFLLIFIVINANREGHFGHCFLLGFFFLNCCGMFLSECLHGTDGTAESERETKM